MISQVQYLRGLAAMMVVWHHALGQLAATSTFIHVPPWGAYGVDLFFAISGFIMLVTTWDKPITPMEFMQHRIRRVVPLYWVATLFMAALVLLAPALFRATEVSVAAIAKSLFFVPYESPNWPGVARPVLLQGWSLNYEIFFYVLFSATLLVGRNWRVPIMVGVLCTLVMAGFVLHPSNYALRAYTDVRMLEFGAGMIMGRLWVMRKHTRRGGGNPVLMALGDASYSIYLTHIFTLGALRVVWVRLVPEATMASSIALMAASLIASAAAGWLCYRLVERPLTQWISKRRLVVRIEVLEGAK